MAYKDEREASYTAAERKAGTQTLNIYKPTSVYDKLRAQGLTNAQIQKRLKQQQMQARNAIPQAAIVEKGQDWETLARQNQVPVQSLIQANEGVNPLAGTAINIPTVKYTEANVSAPLYAGGSDLTSNQPMAQALTADEQYFMDNAGESAPYIDFLTHQETLNASGQYKFDYNAKPITESTVNKNGLSVYTDAAQAGNPPAGYDTYGNPFWLDENGFPTFRGATSPVSENGIAYNYGLNTQEANMFVNNTEGMRFWDIYGQTEKGTMDMSGYQPSKMIETGGLPESMKWYQDENGKWTAKNPEESFDELYILNGIDPNDKAMVEAFWSYADEDLLRLGEFFGVIEWPQGGYGGYGAMPTPYQQYSRGYQPASQRGDYASYLSLTSWSI